MADPVRPTREEAEAAVRTLLSWAGDDPAREGLIDTPKRVAKAYADWFSGYAIDPDEYLARTLATCPTARWWGSASWHGWSMSTPGACRCRRK